MLPGAHRAGKWSPDACTQIAIQRESNMTFHVLQHKANVHTYTHTLLLDSRKVTELIQTEPAGLPWQKLTQPFRSLSCKRRINLSS